MAWDWALASLHHLAILGLVAVLAGELAMTAGAVDGARAGRLVRLDAWYGIAAGIVFAAGLARVFLGDKGAAYYGGNALFWAKMAVFALVAAISVGPTLAYFKWRRDARHDARFVAPPARVAAVRRALYVEAGLVALLPVLAAGMARGFGS